LCRDFCTNTSISSFSKTLTAVNEGEKSVNFSV
jgi:hypothetical protein